MTDVLEPLAAPPTTTPWVPIGPGPPIIGVAPSVRVSRLSTQQSIPTGAWTTLTFDTVQWDTGAPALHWASANPSRLTCQIAGTYVVTGTFQLSTAAGGAYRELMVMVNGGYWGLGGTANVTWAGTGVTPATVQTILNLNVGDYVELQLYQDSGAAMLVPYTTGTTYTFAFGMAMVGGPQGPQGPAGFPGTQGPDIASAATITVSNRVHRVTGNTTITTINGGAAGMVVDLVAVTAGGFAINANGNVATTASPQPAVYVPQYCSCRLVFDNTSGWWYTTPSGGMPVLPYNTSLITGTGITNGQEAILVDSVTAPTYQWRFRYNAGNTTAYKWEFVGGRPLMVGPAGYFSGAIGTGPPGTALANGPTVTIPRAGYYDIEWGMDMNNNVFVGAVGYNCGVFDASNNEYGGAATTIASAQYGGGSMTSATARATLAAGTVLHLNYWAGSTGSSSVAQTGYITVTPQAVS
jgi:hypothetical protein